MENFFPPEEPSLKNDTSTTSSWETAEVTARSGSLVQHNHFTFEVLYEHIVSSRTAKGQFHGHTLSLVLSQPYATISTLRPLRIAKTSHLISLITSRNYFLVVLCAVYHMNYNMIPLAYLFIKVHLVSKMTSDGKNISGLLYRCSDSTFWLSWHI